MESETTPLADDDGGLAMKLPLRLDRHGRYLIGQTRITFGLVVDESERGFTAEQIVARYDSLDLGEVHQVLGFYLTQPSRSAGMLRAERELEAAGTPWDAEIEANTKKMGDLLRARMAALHGQLQPA